MSDSSGQLAYGCQLFRANELVLGFSEIFIGCLKLFITGPQLFFRSPKLLVRGSKLFLAELKLFIGRLEFGRVGADAVERSSQPTRRQTN